MERDDHVTPFVPPPSQTDISYDTHDPSSRNEDTMAMLPDLV